MQDKPQIRFDDDDPRVAYNRVWFNLQRAQRRLNPAINKALQGIGIPDSAWYEVLLALEKAGAEGMPMSMLERRLFMPQYSLSRLVARIEARGYVRRETKPGDRRAQMLFITDAGLGLHERIWPIYMAAIQEAVSGHLSTEDAYELARRLIPLFDDDLVQKR